MDGFHWLDGAYGPFTRETHLLLQKAIYGQGFPFGFPLTTRKGSTILRNTTICNSQAKSAMPFGSTCPASLLEPHSGEGVRRIGMISSAFRLRRSLYQTQASGGLAHVAA